MTSSRNRYEIVPTNKFKRQLRKIAKSGSFTKKDKALLDDCIDKLACFDKILVLEISEIGSHSELF